MSPQALCAVGSPLSVSWFLPAEVSGIDLWSSSLEVGNPLRQLMVSQSYALFCREHQASSLVHTMCILYSCKCQYHPIPTSVVSASKRTRASIVPLGIFWFALALPIKQIHWKDHIQWVYLVLEPIFWQVDKKGVYRSSSGAPRYPIILWYLWLIIIFLILPMNMSEDPPICKSKHTVSCLQVDQKRHLQLMDTSLQLFYLLWTQTAGVLCYRGEVSQWKLYWRMVLQRVVWICADMPEE